MIRSETTPIIDDAARQYKDATTTFVEWERSALLADKYSGGMVWKRVKSFEYLVRTTRKGKQTSLGRRTAETEACIESFFCKKTEFEAQLKSLRASLERHVRVNKALRVGRVPARLIEFLQSLQHAGASAALYVIGPEALFAYESAAVSRFDASLVPLSFGQSGAGPPRPLVLATDADAADALDALRAADASFKPAQDKPGQFRSARGLEVTVVSVRPGEAADLGAFWAAPKRDLAWLATAPRWSAVVVGSSGRMARLPTVDPRAFVMHHDWRSATGGADARAVAIAEAVERLVDRALPQFDFAELPEAPVRS